MENILFLVPDSFSYVLVRNMAIKERVLYQHKQKANERPQSK